MSEIIGMTIDRDKNLYINMKILRLFSKRIL